jgi:hypothetical protein
MERKRRSIGVMPAWTLHHGPRNEKSELMATFAFTRALRPMRQHQAEALEFLGGRPDEERNGQRQKSLDDSLLSNCRFAAQQQASNTPRSDRRVLYSYFTYSRHAARSTMGKGVWDGSV